MPILIRHTLMLKTSGLHEHGFELRDQLVDINLHELPPPGLSNCSTISGL